MFPTLQHALWQLTALALVADLAGWPQGLAWAIALTALHTLASGVLQRSATNLAMQVRVLYLAMLLVGMLPAMRWMHVVQCAGLVVRLVWDYCLAARLLTLLPWNRDVPLTRALAWWVFTAPPAPGAINARLPRPARATPPRGGRAERSVATTRPAELAPPPASRRAWLMVVASAVLVAMGFGAINNISVFLLPLGMEYHWPRADLSLAYSIATLGTGLGGVVLGAVADRWPIRRIVMCGALAPGIAFLLLSRLDSTRELYAYHALIGLLGLGALMAPLNSVAAQWMPARPGLAIGVVSAGGALGQGAMPFLGRHLVLEYGWRPAYLMLGVLSLAVMVPLAALLRNAPPAAAGAAPAAAPGGRGASASPTWRLAWLCVAVLLCCSCMATPIVHVAALGADLGLGGRESAGLLAVMMFSGMAGRLAFGRVADRFGSLQSYIAASAGQTALAVLFPVMPTQGALYALSAAFGLVFSGAMTSFILCAREYSPPHRTGLSIGVVMLFAWIGMALGAWQGGLFFDLCGSYGPSFANASLTGVANLLVLGLLYIVTVHRPRRSERALIAGAT